MAVSRQLGRGSSEQTEECQREEGLGREPVFAVQSITLSFLLSEHPNFP